MHDVAQIVSRLYAVGFFILCCVLLFFVKLNTCSSFVESFLGLAPLQVWWQTHLLATC